eukprot:12056364-Ditylum_brightwellii.AAC.1
MQHAVQVVDNVLATATHALRCTVSSALGMSPGALAFHPDMILNLPILANLDPRKLEPRACSPYTIVH